MYSFKIRHCAKHKKAGILFSVSSCFSMLHMKALAMRGPSGGTIATPSICPCRFPSNCKNLAILLVAILNSSIKSDFVMLRLFSLLNLQSFLRLFLRCSRWFHLQVHRSYCTKMSWSLIFVSRSSSANWNMSLMVWSMTDHHHHHHTLFTLGFWSSLCS